MTAISIGVEVKPGSSINDTAEFAYSSQAKEVDSQTGDITLEAGECDLVFELMTSDVTWNSGADAGTPHPVSFRLGKASDGRDTCWIWRRHRIFPETKRRYSGSQFTNFILSPNAKGVADMVLRVHAVNSEAHVFKYRLGVGARVSPQKTVPLTSDPKIKNTGSGFLERLRALFGIT